MSRRFSVKTFNIEGMNVKLKFESEQLNEDGVILTKDLFEETSKLLIETLPTMKDKSHEEITEEVYEAINVVLSTDPNNKYENMMGDKYQRTKLISLELFDTEGNSTIYED